MARITVEDCLDQVDNRFRLIHLAAKRVRQLKKGMEPEVVCKNKDIVVALREIAAGAVFQVKGNNENDPLIEAGPEGSPAGEDQEPLEEEMDTDQEAVEEK